MDVSNVGQGDQAELAVYSIFEGQYPPENLTALPSVNTILGMLKQQDYVIKVFEDDTGQLYAQGLAENNTAKILEVKQNCNGVAYKVDQVLLPAEKESQIFSRYGDGMVVLQIYANGSRCAVPLLQAVRDIPNTQQWADLWNKTGLINQFRYGKELLGLLRAINFGKKETSTFLFSAEPSSLNHLI